MKSSLNFSNQNSKVFQNSQNWSKYKASVESVIKEHDPNTDLNPQKFFFQKENEFYRTIDDDILQYEDTEDNQARPKTQG